MSMRMRIRQTRTSPGVPPHVRSTEDHGPASIEMRDRGVSLIEIIVAVTLMTTVVIAVLSAVGVTVKATAYERDHAKAQQWLQAAIGVIEAVDFSSCDPLVINGTNVQADYQAAIDVEAQRPWEYEGELTVALPEVWDGSEYVPFDSQTVCYDEQRLRQQLVRMVVNHPSGVEESVEMIKVDR